jgi:hypothetical protein
MWTLAVVLLILWALGFFGGFVATGAIHTLLVVILIIVVVQLILGKRPW